MQDIIAFENGTIYCCEQKREYNKECSCYDKSTSYCSSKYYKELESLCSTSENSFFNCLKKEDNHIKCLKYAGYFQLSDGRGVWILPKIKTGEEGRTIDDTGRQIFKNLVETALSINNVKTGSDTLTDLDKEKVFIAVLIKLFCFHMDNLFKKGIKKHYSLAEDNLPYLKGKIKFSEHIKRNITSKEKFYVEFDEFTEDIPENRILVSACNYLIKKINNMDEKKAEQLTESKKKLKRYIQELGDIDESKNLIKDFAKLQRNRLYEHYDKPLLFAEVFLSHKNYWLNRGRKKFPAIMFSLHELFEDYIRGLIKAILPELKGVEFRPQFRGKNSVINYLFAENTFATKMDFVLYKVEQEQKENNEEKEQNNKKSKYIVLDAKYKIINLQKDIDDAKNEDEEKDIDKIYQKSSTHISQSDLYQVFTYSEIIKEKYKKENPEIEIALLYPKNENFKEKMNFHYFNGTKITFIPIDLTIDLSMDLKQKDINNIELIKYLKEYFK